MHLFAMRSMVLVLGCIVAVINIMNYRNVNEDADRTLNIISTMGEYSQRIFQAKKICRGKSLTPCKLFFIFNYKCGG